MAAPPARGPRAAPPHTIPPSQSPVIEVVDPTQQYEAEWAQRVEVLRANGVPLHGVGTRYLSEGCYGDDVGELQRYLQSGGYLATGEFNAGFFGSLTREAVRAWQLDHDVPPTGGFGELSRQAYLHERSSYSDSVLRSSFLSPRSSRRADSLRRAQARRKQLARQERALERARQGAGGQHLLLGAGVALLASQAAYWAWKHGMVRLSRRGRAEAPPAHTARPRTPRARPPTAPRAPGDTPPRPPQKSKIVKLEGEIDRREMLNYWNGALERDRPAASADALHDGGYRPVDDARHGAVVPDFGRAGPAPATGFSNTGWGTDAEWGAGRAIDATSSNTEYALHFDDERGVYAGGAAPGASASPAAEPWRSKYNTDSYSPALPSGGARAGSFSPFGGYVQPTAERPRRVVDRRSVPDGPADVRLADITGAGLGATPKLDGSMSVRDAMMLSEE